MSTQLPASVLHLPSLSIEGFRGIAKLSIPRLGRVTLIAGMNGVGKTTVLEAVRIYAARGSYSVLSSILRSREEHTTMLDEDGDEVSVPDFEALAYGRHPTDNTYMSIGPADAEAKLRIRFRSGLWQQGMLVADDTTDFDDPVLTVEFQGTQEGISVAHLSRTYPTRRVSGRSRRHIPESNLPDAIQCESAGPSVMDNYSMSRYWDSVALTDYETQAIQALQLIYGESVERVAMVGDEGRPRGFNRRALVRLEGQERPVPLKSLGDGAVRIFGTALAIANSRNGFFVIDEAENGIHHSVQADYWKMVLKTALENNVQVLATTHSWDCAFGFNQAATEMKEVDGLLVRIDRIGDRMRTVEYTEEDLNIAIKQRIEFR